LNARKAALTVLERVAGQGAYLNLELKSALPKEMSAEDRRFAVALVSTAIENLYRIDYIIAQFSHAKRMHGVIRNILRLGVCQLMYFESVPVSAAVNESVKLAEGVGKRQLKGFVNAILRNVANNAGNMAYPAREGDFAEYLHIMYSYPKWLCERYIEDYGKEFAEEMLGYHGDPSLTCVRQNRLRQREPLSQFEPGRYLDDAWYIRNAAGIERMPLYREGRIAVQGEASMICVRAAGIRAADEVLDVCAAPGGKSAYAAQIAVDGHVVARDIHGHRVKLIKETLARLGVENARAEARDAAVPDEAGRGAYDVVLVDAPCSALGLLYRKPDIKIRKEADDISSLAALQRQILDASAGCVKPGGTLLYSTCTISRSENGDNARWFLERHRDFVPCDLKNELPEALMHRAEGNMLQLFPHIDGIDGFFIARFKRV